MTEPYGMDALDRLAEVLCAKKHTGQIPNARRLVAMAQGERSALKAELKMDRRLGFWQSVRGWVWVMKAKREVRKEDGYHMFPITGTDQDETETPNEKEKEV